MNIEFRAAVDLLELLDCLRISLALVTGAESSLVDHSFEMSEEPECYIFD